MRIVFDTCVLVPSFLREVLLACAEVGQADYIVSHKILTEWSNVAKSKLDKLEAEIAVAEFRKTHPLAISSDAASLAQFWLPDLNDIHVLALAVEQNADAILTFNKKDFPRSEVYRYDLQILDPDEFLRNLFKKNRYEIYRVLQPILRRAQDSNVEMSMLELWKKAWLPQFGRLVERL